jgi:hypothetical protein
MVTKARCRDHIAAYGPDLSDRCDAKLLVPEELTELGQARASIALRGCAANHSMRDLRVS